MKGSSTEGQPVPIMHACMHVHASLKASGSHGNIASQYFTNWNRKTHYSMEQHKETYYVYMCILQKELSMTRNA